MNEPQLKLFISNLAVEWSETVIKEYFQSFASVLSVLVFREGEKSNLQVGLGCAYVLFARKSEAEQVLNRLNKPKGHLIIRWADGEMERLRAYKAPTFIEYATKEGRPYYWNSATGNTQWERPNNSTIIPPSQAPSVNPNDVTSSQGSSGCNLFIFHIPNDWTELELRSHFGVFGNITSARVMLDKVTGKSRGFGFVSFDNPSDATKAMQQMNGYQEGGKRLKVQLKRENNLLNY